MTIPVDEFGSECLSEIITLCDYKMCPTIKSENGRSMIIVVKTDGNLHPIEDGRNHSGPNHCKPIEKRKVGGTHQ